MTPERPILDEVVIAGLESFGGDMLAGLVPLYFDQAAGQLSQLGRAIARGEALVVRDTAHSLKGSSSTLGATRVARISSELEAVAKTGDLSTAGELLGSLRSRLDETSDAFRDRTNARSPSSPQR
jgi:HPt (histidine-containing phosphotransfer) domain-containing protein